LYEPCRTSKSDDANEHAPIYPPDQRFQQEAGKLAAAVALHFAHYNLVRLHKSLRVTPAMAANVTDRLWSLEELVDRTSK
jgi:hypothetical protein